MEIKIDNRLEIEYLKAKYREEGLIIDQIDWNFVIKYEKLKNKAGQGL